jgi:hypothetical protein
LQKVVIGIVEDWREVQMELRLIREDVEVERIKIE